MPAVKTCLTCGKPVNKNAQRGLCPDCLMRALAKKAGLGGRQTIAAKTEETDVVTPLEPGAVETASPRSSAVLALSHRFRAGGMAEGIFLGLLLFFLAVLVFIPAFNGGFLWSDHQMLTANPQVHGPDGWWTLWLKPQTADYFPLTSTTFWVEWHLWAMNGAGYHITNVLLHAIVALLTWQTLKRLRVPGAWIAAAIFAVHPVCVESVAWIAERTNLIAQIFLLLTIAKYVAFEETGRLRTYFLALLCFTLSLLAKTSVVMLPCILLLLAWWRRAELDPLMTSYKLEVNQFERGILLWSCVAAGAMAEGALLVVAPMLGLSLSDAILPYLMVIGALAGGCAGYALGLRLRKLELWNSFSGFSIIRVLPFFLVALPLGAVTIYFQFNRAIGGEEIPIGNWWQRLVSASFAIAFYLYSAFWPFNIMGLYPEWQRAFPVFVTQPTPHVQPPAPESISFWIQVIPGLAIAGLLAFCWLRRTETWARALLVALGCYIIALLPELGLVRISYLRLTLFADHYQYISIIAIIALVVAAASARTLKPPWLYIASLCFAIISYFNWKQTPDTHFAQLIWIAGPLLLATVPTMAPQFMAYGWGAFAAAALACFSVISWGHAAIYHDEKTFFSATLKKNPYTWQGYNHLGAALYMEGNWRAAGLDFLKAVQLKPENPESHNNLGLYYSMLEDLPDAIREYRTAVNIKDDSAMRTNLANAYEHSKQYDPAIENYRHAIALNESNASAHCNLGYGLMQQGRIDEAIPEFMRTIELDPRMPQGPTNLAQALRIKGIDLNAPPVTGSFSFDANKAFELLRSAPPSPPRQHQPDR